MSVAPPLTVRLHIISPAGSRLPPVELSADPATTLRELLGRLAREDALPPGGGWTFRARDGTPLDPNDPLREVAARFVSAGGVLELILVAQAGPIPGAAPGAPPPAARSAAPRPAPAAVPPPAADEDEEADEATFDHTLPSSRAGEAPSRRAKAKARHAGTATKPAKALAERRATVRYYTRMNPDRMFPLLVVLSAKQIEEVVKKSVKQAVSESFKVEEGSLVEIEPVLPGCDCYPPRHALAVESKDATTETFWIVPRVLGRVHGARVLVRQGDRVLADIPLDVKVSKQTLAVACGLMSLAAPYLTMGLKSLQLDYESQKADGFPLYQQAGSWIAENLRPEWIGLGFLGLAFHLYLWMRPRRRDVFWDVNVK
jgi:hypothetical protein